MAQSPQFKVFNPYGEYVAACKHPEDAAAIVAVYGDGASIRHTHDKSRTFWVEGETGVAGDSYDEVYQAWRDFSAKA